MLSINKWLTNYTINKKIIAIFSFSVFSFLTINKYISWRQSTIKKNDDENNNLDKKVEDIKNILDVKIKNFLKSKNIKNHYIISKCLVYKESLCESLKKFMKTINSTNNWDSFVEFIEDKNNYIFAFHGTETLNNAENICCQSWNIDNRGKNGQAYGKGEYFTTEYETASKYAGKNGAILISIILKNDKNIKVVNKSYGETWYVINNTNDETSCLPIAILRHESDITTYKMCQTEKNMADLQKIIEGSNDIYYEDKNIYVPYDKNSKKIIFENIKKGNYVFDLVAENGNTYNIDLINMTQNNKKTNFIRKIIVE
jgi:hypothetical protein